MKKRNLITVLIVLMHCSILAQQKITLVEQQWEANSWMDRLRMTTLTNSQDIPLKSTTELMDSITNNWENETQVLFALNPDGTLKEGETNLWEPDSKIWENLSKIEYTYDSIKRVATTTTKMYMAFNSSWLTMTKQINTWQKDSVMISHLQFYDLKTSQFKDFSRTRFSFNKDGTERMAIDEMWSDSITNWEFSARSSSTYNSFKKPVAKLFENYSNGQWYKERITTSTYNPDITLKEEFEQIWDKTISNWKDSVKTTFKYNSEKFISESLIQISKTNTWVNSSRIIMNYETITSSESLKDITEIVVYPNPTNKLLYIKSREIIDQIEVLNSAGRIVYSKSSGQNSDFCDFEGLNSGTYIVRIRSGNIIKTMPVIRSGK